MPTVHKVRVSGRLDGRTVCGTGTVRYWLAWTDAWMPSDIGTCTGISLHWYRYIGVRQLCTWCVQQLTCPVCYQDEPSCIGNRTCLGEPRSLDLFIIARLLLCKVPVPPYR